MVKITAHVVDATDLVQHREQVSPTAARYWYTSDITVVDQNGFRFVIPNFPLMPFGNQVPKNLTITVE